MNKPDRPKKKAQGREAKGASKTSKTRITEVRHHNSAGDKAASKAKAGGKARRALGREAQVALLLEVLRRRPVDTFELRRLGMASPAARVQDLEALGCVIDSARIVAVDSDGFSHYGVALYSLISEPEVVVDLEASS
ncbi:MAG: helix-turn-helix domain-containing protein [Hydrogenophaga sp.]|nr:helix-turn-helix domain-containing protein [Hydrogenophaga sp.]